MQIKRVLKNLSCSITSYDMIIPEKWQSRVWTVDTIGIELRRHGPCFQTATEVFSSIFPEKIEELLSFWHLTLIYPLHWSEKCNPAQQKYEMDRPFCPFMPESKNEVKECRTYENFAKTIRSQKMRHEQVPGRKRLIGIKINRSTAPRPIQQVCRAIWKLWISLRVIGSLLSQEKGLLVVFYTNDYKRLYFWRS